MTLETLSTARSFGGTQGVYRHASKAAGTDMTFAVFVPPQAADGPCPVVTYLSGLTCTHANVMEKGEYRRVAAELGIVVVCPDTSPRGEGVPNDEAYDFGQGAGFYVDADEAPWKTNFRMYSYVTRELIALVAEHFPVDMARHGVFGHSMGGHGALTLALREPQLYKSVSAFSPIVNPMQVPWGRKAFEGYLGKDEKRWRQHDAVALIEDGRRWTLLPGPIPIHAPVRILQGGKDDAVPWRHALKTAEALAGGDVVFTLVKDGDHRLSREADIARLIATAESLLA